MNKEQFQKIYKDTQNKKGPKGYHIEGEQLTYNGRKVVQFGQTEGILALYHSSDLGGHRGISTTFNWIRDEYYWPNMFKDVKEFVASCHTCQMQNVKFTPEPVHKLVVTSPWERVQIDVIGPLEMSEEGNRYIITAIDCFTRWPEARPVKAANAETIIRFVWEEIICRYGTIETIQTDQETEFVNQKFQQFCKDKGIHHHIITAYHPQANGMIERLNGTIKRTLMKIANESYEWDKALPAALFSI